MCKDTTARMIIKQQAGVPTVPVSADHRNGDWIATDIYEGEFAMDTDTGQVYTRTDAGIKTASGEETFKRFKAKISQAGTGAPTIVSTAINTLGVVPTFAYASTGTYTITATGLFTLDKTYTEINQQIDNQFVLVPIDVNTINILTGTGAYPSVLTNTLLFKTDIDILIY